MELFPREQIVGVFRGFSKGGLEFHADLTLPYRNDFQNLPMHGQFLLVQLETEEEAVLGRITSLFSAGKLAGGAGEEFNIRAVREGRVVPEDIREQYLKYNIDIRVLGVVRRNRSSGLTFVASHRRLPHVGSPVAFLSAEVLCELAGHNTAGAEIGHFAMGEYVYGAASDQLLSAEWMQVKEPEVLVKFPVSALVSRRTFVFARAGFGKSNLNKLLFSRLYSETPTVTKRAGEQVPVGTVLFDPDGEYFWPDDKGRPGLCDVPELEDKLVVFTNRRNPSPFYQSFVAGGIKLDIRRLTPADVISVALSPEVQDQQNVRKLRGLSKTTWQKLVDLIDEFGYQAPEDEVRKLLALQPSEEAQLYAARANMTTIVRMLHDKSSQFLDRLLSALTAGKLCVVDVSQLRGTQGQILSGLLLRQIFDRNQEEFTKARPRTIPTIAVVEEAQAVLNERAAGSEPYISWVKEGRKYDLGAVLITQQPGSISNEILSQGDNWFIFHLLSAGDLESVRHANAHFSSDILSALLNEPIPGHGVFWSSANERPYPISLRVLSFEKMYEMRDPTYSLGAADTFARKLSEEFEEALGPESTSPRIETAAESHDGQAEDVEPVDQMKLIHEKAVAAIRAKPGLIESMKGEGVSWGSSLNTTIKDVLPPTFVDVWKVAYEAVAPALNEIFGEDGWETFKDSSGKTWVRTTGRGEGGR